MTEGLGERLTELEEDDSVVVMIDGGCYAGTVTEIDRWKCDLVQGFMESGGIAIYIEMSAETIRRHDAPEKHLLISAEENVPNDWDVPKGAIYNYPEGERSSLIGELTEIEITNNPSG